MKLPPLDPRFGKLVALMESTTHEAERTAARRKAESVLTPDVGGFDRARRILAYHRAREAAPNNPFAGFDEHVEIDNPGHMARQAAVRAQKLKHWHERRAGLVERYGSLEAVVAPCARERLLLKALKAWRTPGKRPHQRWTWEINGWSVLDRADTMAADLRAAVEGAIPMPATFAEACAELAYWRERNDDMEHALGVNGRFDGNYGLDRVAVARMEIISELVEHEMKLWTLPEILQRFRIHRASEAQNPETEQAIFRDLEALSQTFADPVR